MTENAPTHDEGVAKVAELIAGRRAAMLVTRALDGGLASRPMALPERDFDGTLWFLSERETEKVAEIEADPHVNVSFADGTYLSLNGLADVVQNPDCKAELWDDIMEQWFAAGPESDALVAVKIDVLAAEYWETVGRPSVVLPLVREAVTTGRPQLAGDEEVVAEEY